MKPLFICGCARSGTTICQKILDSHPLISITNEMQIIELYHTFLNRLFIRGDPRGHKDLKDRWGDFSINDLLENETLSTICNGLKLGLIAEHKQRKPDMIYYGDKSPPIALRMDLVNKVFPDAKIITCTRNREDTIASLVRNLPDEFDKEKDAERAYEDFQKLKVGFILDLDECKKDPYKMYQKVAEYLDIDDRFDTSLFKVD